MAYVCAIDIIVFSSSDAVMLAGTGMQPTKGTANVGDSGATKKSKPDMCAAIGARVLIDDSIKYARQCRGLDRVVLFGNYGHNQEGSADWGDGTFPDNVTRCGNWKDAAAAVIELAQSGGSAEKR